uniref:Clathrin light chain n=2 Tax=Anas TaxID=8835 RepID=A0A8B9VHM4_9AVES
PVAPSPAGSDVDGAACLSSPLPSAARQPNRFFAGRRKYTSARRKSPKRSRSFPEKPEAHPPPSPARPLLIGSRRVPTAVRLFPETAGGSRRAGRAAGGPQDGGGGGGGHTQDGGRQTPSAPGPPPGAASRLKGARNRPEPPAPRARGEAEAAPQRLPAAAGREGGRGGGPGADVSAAAPPAAAVTAPPGPGGAEPKAAGAVAAREGRREGGEEPAMADDFGFFSSSEAGGAEEDPAAAFLAQQESEIAGIENDEAFGPTDGEGASAGPGQAAPQEPAGFQNGGATVNGDVFQESNGPTDAYAAIAKADRLTQEPESIRKWREEQKKRLEELDAASKVTEQEWREKAKKDLEEWNLRQNEQMEKNRANNRASEEAFLKESKEESPGSEWEKVAQLCDFNPKSSKQSKDVSRMRSVLISLKQTPLSR